MTTKRTETNNYTVIFAVVLVVIIGAALAFTAETLKPEQKRNVELEKMQNILSSMDIELKRDEAQKTYKEIIKKSLVIDYKGNPKEKEDAFVINASKEANKPLEKRSFPIFIGDYKNVTYYIVPVQGKGLWGPIWGYVSIKKDITIGGVVFDHASETPGLGAEIKDNPNFRKMFIGEHLVKDGKFVGVTLDKNNNDPLNQNKMDAKVDAISGATITGNGVSKMLYTSLSPYIAYIQNN